jgi:hypothetical protein
VLAKPLLVLSSYSILFALLAIRVQVVSLRVALLVLTLVGVAALILLFRLDARSTRSPHVIKTIEQPGPEAGAYMASYLLPFVISSTPGLWDVIAYAVFLIVAGIVTAYTGAIQVNPLIYLMGRRVVRVIDEQDYSFYLVVRGRPTTGSQVWVTQMSQNVAVMRTPPSA